MPTMKWTIIFYFFLVDKLFCQDCEHFANIRDGTISYEPENEISLASGARAILRCSTTGFETTAVCREGNWHPPSLGTCFDAVDLKLSNNKRQQTAAPGRCSALPAPTNSFITYSTFGLPPFNSGTMAMLNCFLGYSPIGQTAAECEDGKWTEIGTCQNIAVQRCPPLLQTPHGMINYISGGNGPYDYGSIAELTCGFGYSINGNTRVTCESNGWAPSSGLGQCQEGFGTSSGLGCSVLSVFNGQINYIQSNPSIPYSSGTSANLACNLGFMPSGSSSSYCQNGVWSPTIGSCVSSSSMNGLSRFGTTSIGSLGGLGSATAQCYAMLAPFNGQVQYSSGSSTFGPFPSGTIANTICNSGFYISGTSSSTCVNGMWNPSALGTCTSSGTGFGTSGFGTTGFSTSGSTCFAVATPLNGQVQYSQSAQGLGTYTSGTSATLMCNYGYYALGSSTTTCYNGQWNPVTLGTCTSSGSGLTSGWGTTGTTCSAMATPLNGQVQYSQSAQGLGTYSSGTSATLICNSGYYALGSSTTTCYNGQWNPVTLGTCTSSGSGLASGWGTTGTTCPAMATPLNGQVQYSQSAQGLGTYSSGTSATLMCNSGYYASGSSTSTCYSGQWNPVTLGTCTSSGSGTTGWGSTGLTCLTIATPLNGQITYSQSSVGLGSYNSGTTANLICYSGSVSGSSYSQCTSGMWQPTIGTCSSASFGTTGGFGTSGSSYCYSAMPAVISGTISYSTGSQFGPFPSGSTATLYCTNGIAQGQTTAYCQSGIWSPSMFSGCSSSSFGSNSLGGFGTTSGGQCFATLAPLGGQIRYSSGSTFGPFPSGSTAQLTCNQGYTISGSSSSSCYNGQWSPTLGTCIMGSSTSFGSSGTGIGNCYAFPQPTNGYVSYSTLPSNSAYTSGTQATLSCNIGYTSVGTTSANCQGTGWSTLSLGSCMQSNFGSQQEQRKQSSDCDSNLLPLVSNGQLEPTADPNVVQVVCHTGFASQVSQVTIYCQNGEIRTKESATCVPFATALADKSNKDTTCTFPVVHVERGQILYSSGSNYPPFLPGTVATLICEFGTTATGGSSTSTCIQGQWSQTLGICLAPGIAAEGQCQTLERVPGGNIAYSEIFNPHGPFNEGTFATLMCDFGRRMEGPATATCQNSSWVPTIGKCANPNELPTGGGTYAAPTRHPVQIRCPPIKSTSLKSTLEFDQTPLSDGNYPNSTIVRLICLEDGALVANGKSAAECLNGTWKPKLGECDVVQEDEKQKTKIGGPAICQPLETPKNAKITYIQSGKQSYQIGTTAILNCPFGSTVNGNAALSCGPKGTWLPSSFGKCVLNTDLVH